jgi:hypothetical protein
LLLELDEESGGVDGVVVVEEPDDPDVLGALELEGGVAGGVVFFGRTGSCTPGCICDGLPELSK